MIIPQAIKYRNSRWFRSLLTVGVLFLFLSSCQLKGLFQSDKAGGDKSAPQLSEQQQIKLERKYIEGTTQKMLENYENAKTLFLKCLKINPTHAPSYYQLAKIHLRFDQSNKALSYAKKAVRYDSDNKWYKKAYANTLKKQKKYKKAAEIYQRLAEQYPNNHQYYLRWAFMHISAQEWEKALDVYKKLEEKTGVNKRIIQQKQKLYLRSGQFDKAVEEVKKLIKTNPENASYHIMLADLYRANDYTDKAIDKYEKALDLNPNHAKAQLKLAKVYKKKGQKEKYRQLLEKVFANPQISIDKKIKTLVRDFGLLEQKSEKTPVGVDLSQVLVETHPQQAKAYSVYGDFLYQNEEPKKALQQYEKALELDNSRFSIWRQLLRINYELSRYQNLLKTAQQAEEYFPNQPTIFYFKSVALIQQNKYEKAVEALDKGLMLQPQDKFIKAQMYANLGEAHYQLKNYSASDSSYDKALELNPENAYVLNNYSFFLSERGDKLNKAKKMAKKANELQPNNSAFQDTYGWILYKLGDYEKAKQWIEKAMGNGGDKRHVIVEHYGDVLFKLGQKDKALEYWKKAKDLGDQSDKLLRKIANRQLYE